MKSLSARLTILYAASFLALSAAMLAIGYREINLKLIRALDSLLATERARVFNHLALGQPSADPDALRAKLQRSTDNSATLFLVEIRSPEGRTLFRSRNLATSLAVPNEPWTFRSAFLQSGARVRVGRFHHRNMIVLIATPTRNVDTAMRGYVETSVGLLLAMAVISISLGYLLSQVALRPLRQIAATAARVRPDNLAERIVVQRVDDEVGALARLLNAMLDRIESSFRQIRQFTADASHELKTPLSLIRLQAEALLADEACTEAQENAIVALLEQIDRIAAMVEDLLLLARADSNSLALALDAHDPAAFLEELRADAEVLAEAGGRSVAIEHHGEGIARFDARWVRQIVLNLLSNALRASSPGGTVRISSTLASECWSLSVEDNGPGVPDEQRHRIFDRFFTSSDSGTGLGLAICRSFVDLHGGTISAEAGDHGHGLKVSFALPRRA